MEAWVLGVDIGGSKVLTGLVSAQGETLGLDRFSWAPQEGREAMDQVVAACRRLLERPGLPCPQAVGVTIPGLADPEPGIWVESSFSGIREVPVAPMLGEALGLPVWVRNDAQACALAEARFGAGRGMRDFLYLTVSNGIGGALYLGGALYPGAAGYAGELGHVEAVPGGRPCGCGKRGCLEQHAAGPGIAQNYAALGGVLKPGQGAKEIAGRARLGETAALETFRLEGLLLGRALAAAVNLLNPARVILGGGVSLSFDLFEEALRTALSQGLYRRANLHLQVLPSPLGARGGLLGAAALALDRAAGG